MAATSFTLASNVDPGPSVHESKEHGIRLTVQDGSLNRPIGSVTIHEIAQTVKCENDSKVYRTKTVVNCQPSGDLNSGKPLLADFLVEVNPFIKATEAFQVVIRGDEGGEWTKVESKVRVDQWGTCLRAKVNGFSWMSAVAVVDPTAYRKEASKTKDMIGVKNATGAIVYLVLTPDARTVTRTATVGLGQLSTSVSATTVRERSPDSMTVFSGDSDHFLAPAGSQGSLVVATLLDQPQATPPVRVVDVYASFRVSAGTTIVVLPGMLERLKLGTASLGSEDSVVDAVLTLLSAI